MGVVATSFAGDYAIIEADKEQMLYYLEMGIAHGSNEAATVCGQEYIRGNILERDCRKAIYYYSIAAQLENAEKNYPGARIEFFNAERYLPILKSGLIKGRLAIDDKAVITKPCLTEAEYEQAIAESIITYEAIKAAKDAERAAHDALYDAAHARLPEVRAAYEQALRENAE